MTIMDRAALLDELRAQTQAWMEQYQVPGVAIGLIVDGEEHILCLGVTSIENPLPVTEDTLFQIGSTTKTLTATATMRLVEQGKLDLDATVRTYLPDFRLADESTAARVTLRHLFNHTGGWVGDIFEDTGEGDDALAKIVVRLHEWPQTTPLGELWVYNNAAFFVAGRVIEAVTGATYEAAARELVLEPLGMTHSFFFPTEVMTRRFAAGHFVEDGAVKIMQPWTYPRNVHAAGGLASSARDQLRYARFHMGDGAAEDGRRVLSLETMRAMQTPAVRGPNRDMFGISWFIRDVGDVRFCAHGGSIAGQMSEFWLAPGRNSVCTVLTNGEKGRSVGLNVTQWVREHLLGVAEPEPTPLDLGREQLAAYAGRYVGAADGTTLDLRLGDAGLALHIVPGAPSSIVDTPPPPLPPAPVAVCDGDRLLVLDGDMKGRVSEFLRDEQGKIIWLRSGYRVYAPQAD